MRLTDRIRLSSRAVLLLAIGGAGGAAAVAVATVPGSDGVIHACYTTAPASGLPITTGPNLRIIDAGAGQTCNTIAGAAPVERPITWNVQGPPGTPGVNGKSVTVVSGHTLTLAGGQVITVGGGTAPTYTIINPLPKPSGNQMTLDIDSMTLPILSFSFASVIGGGGVGRHGTGGGAGTGRVNDISVTKLLDKTSAKLALACNTGTPFKTATITLRKGTKLVKYLLSTVSIVGYQAAGHGSGGQLTETFTLAFAKEQIKYSK